MGNSISEVIKNRFDMLPEGLQQHISRVEEVSVELARIHEISQAKVRICARAHDLCRAMKGEELLKTARDLDIQIHSVEERVPILLHGPVAAELLRREGLNDYEVYQGIYHHSTACVGLEPVAKIVFLGDKLDPHKASRYPFLSRVRDKARNDLNEALLEFLNQEIASLLKDGRLIHPSSLEARNDLMSRNANG